MIKIIDGREAAARIKDRVTTASHLLQSSHEVAPGLAVIIVGDDAASRTYVNSKARMAKKRGFHSQQYTLSVETTQEELLALIEKLNRDDAVHGILVQLPLPHHLNSEVAIQGIRPEKDVDGLHVVNAGKLATGDVLSGLISCAPAGAMLLVRDVHGEDLSGLNAVVVGRSNLFGKPMAQLLLHANATVTIAHSRSADLPRVCRGADIMVVAVGRAEIVRRDWIKPGATVIDVGINRIGDVSASGRAGRIVGDVAFDEATSMADALTPVPGGVGPMTIAMLMANTTIAAHRALGMAPPKF